MAAECVQASQAVQCPPVQVFIYQEDRLNAFAFGWALPHSVVLTSGLVEAFSPAELRFVLGHEMGHVALGHTRLSSLIGGLLGAPNVPILSLLLIPIFLWWSRAAEYSADRAGLVACGDLEEALSALTKLLVGPRLAGQVHLEELIAQAQELSAAKGGGLGQLGAAHPYLVQRLQALLGFWGSPECRALVARPG